MERRSFFSMLGGFVGMLFAPFKVFGSIEQIHAKIAQFDLEGKLINGEELMGQDWIEVNEPEQLVMPYRYRSAEVFVKEYDQLSVFPYVITDRPFNAWGLITIRECQQKGRTTSFIRTTDVSKANIRPFRRIYCSAGTAF